MTVTVPENDSDSTDSEWTWRDELLDRAGTGFVYLMIWASTVLALLTFVSLIVQDHRTALFAAAGFLQCGLVLALAIRKFMPRH